MKPSLILTLATIAGAALISTGCSDSGASGPNLVNRELSGNEKSFRLVETSAERFRYQTAPSNPHSGGGGAESVPAPAKPTGLTYTTPEGWQEAPAASMRDVNLSFGENGEGECYVARLPGMGGGLLANVNRWRGQMGADPITQEEADALPAKPLFGQPAKFIKVDGKFAGMGATEGKDDYRMLGLILASDAGAVFVKLTGPRELVEANEDNFDIFTSSLDIGL
ncbi:MAG: hypothetical protein HRU46_03160 [Verrucomicrobiales bacterium]|nr:hypothetical protein [Verrucomicrobiales bacterium]